MSYRPYAAIIQEAVSQAAAGSTGIKFEIQNDSGSSIAALQPVASDANGRAIGIDPSIELQSLKIVGLAESAIPDGGYGNVISHGKILNVTTALNFGDYVYLSKTGGTTGILPEEGQDGFVSGDFVIRLGVIVRNRQIPSQKDLVINIEIVGQL
jgi:hypothetical protein